MPTSYTLQPYSVLSNPALSSLILSCPIFSYPVLLYTTYVLSVMADQMKRESLRTENEEDKSLRPMSLFRTQAQSQMNCQNSIFGFTKILWLLQSKKTIADMICDKDGKEMMFKYLQTTSLLYQIHFEFISQFHLLSLTEVRGRGFEWSGVGRKRFD